MKTKQRSVKKAMLLKGAEKTIQGMIEKQFPGHALRDSRVEADGTVKFTIQKYGTSSFAPS